MGVGGDQDGDSAADGYSAEWGGRGGEGVGDGEGDCVVGVWGSEGEGEGVEGGAGDLTLREKIVGVDV